MLLVISLVGMVVFVIAVRVVLKGGSMEAGGKVVIPERLKRNRAALIREMERIANDPDVREAGERSHREISRLSAEDLLRRID